MLSVIFLFVGHPACLNNTKALSILFIYFCPSKKTKKTSMYRIQYNTNLEKKFEKIKKNL